MKFSITTLIEDHKEHSFIFFWGHQPSKDGEMTKTCFSQWWLAPFTVNEVTYGSAEHWMMAKKAELFGDEEHLRNILADTNSANAKKYGRKVKGFDPLIWEEKAYQIVVEGNFYKFSQNAELGEFLVSTEDKVIVEASPFDPIWGIGTHKHLVNPKEWKGTNLLGFALMEARDRMRIQ